MEARPQQDFTVQRAECQEAPQLASRRCCTAAFGGGAHARIVRQAPPPTRALAADSLLMGVDSAYKLRIVGVDGARPPQPRQRFWVIERVQGNSDDEVRQRMFRVEL